MFANETFSQDPEVNPEIEVLKQITQRWEFSDRGLLLSIGLAVALVFLARRAFSPVEIQWYHAKSTILLKNKDGGHVRLSHLCKSLTPPFHLRPWLYNNHIQTILAMFGTQRSPLFFRRLSFVSETEKYQGTFEVDFSVKPFSGHDPKLPPRTAFYSKKSQSCIASDDSRPMMVVLHGLCGGSHEPYLQSVLAPLMAGKQNWEACVLLSRGCGKSSITGGGMYYAHATSDLQQLTTWLQTTFPNRPLYAIGFSIGANILTRYVAEQGHHCAFKAAVVLSNPWNLELSAVRLQKTFFGRWLYSPAMTANLMKLFRRAKRIETIHGKPLRGNPASRVRLMHEYDRYIQCPTWGFPTERVYYRKASSCDSVLDVKIPFWALNAEDDPIVGDESIPKGEFGVTPYTVLCTTEFGGHLGWVQSDNERWYSRPVVSFLQTMHECEVCKHG